MLRTTKGTREEAPLNSSYREPAGIVFSSALPWMWMVQESNEERSIVSVEAAMVLWREKSQLDWWMSLDAFGVKKSISSNCLSISLSQIQQCQKILGSFEMIGNTTSSSLLILTAPTLMEMPSSGWKYQLASPPGAAGSRKLSPLCGSRWLLHLFSFCHQTLLFKLLGRISQ